MKIVFLSLVFTAFIVFAPANATAQGLQVSIRMHKEKSVPYTGLKIRFLELVEDSRCPEDTNCIWAGNAKVKIWVQSAGKRPETFELNSLTAPQVVENGGYEIRLASLTPNPRSNVKTDPKRYVALFAVRKLAK